METPKINIDREELSDEQMLKHKDFDQVFQTYGKVTNPFYQSFKFWGGLAGITIMATIVTLYFSNKPSNAEVTIATNDTSAVSTQIALTPPFETLDLPYEVFVINTSADTLLFTADGTQLEIPGEIFAYNNVPVTNLVQLKYRQFNTPLDFFLSNIPMTYDSAGTNYTFESAGMIELLAYQNKNKLELISNKAIEVQMPSPIEGTDFNLYQLDDQGNWHYHPNDHAEANNDDVQQPVVPPVDAPVKPIKASGHIFNVEFDSLQFPELMAYKGVFFEVDETEQAFDPDLYNISWHAMELQHAETAKHYLLLLSRPDTTVKLQVYPVYEGASYNKAMEIYNEQYRAYEVYQQQVEQRSDAISATQQHVQAAFGNMRTFSSTSLGIWNFDRPLAPKGQKLEVQFVDNHGNTIPHTTIYMVDKQRNALFTFNDNKIQYKPTSENVLWIITTNGEIAFCSPEAFKSIPSKSKQHTFTMVLMSPNMATNNLKHLIGA